MELLSIATLLGMTVTAPYSALSLTLPLPTDAEQKTVVYQCDGAENDVAVLYVNAAPNFLALMPIGGDRLILAGVLSADGTRYTAGPFEWWSKGNEATFTDLRYDSAKPVACTEKNETP